MSNLASQFDETAGELESIRDGDHTTEVSQQRISLREIQRDLKISDDDFDRMFPEPLQLPDD